MEDRAGTRTYPSGRFLDSGPVANGTVVLDFNRAYNPPCAVTPYATCPLPPSSNRLPVPIPSGEQYRRDSAPAPHGHPGQQDAQGRASATAPMMPAS